MVFDRGNHRIGDFVHVRITEASSATLKGEEREIEEKEKEVKKKMMEKVVEKQSDLCTGGWFPASQGCYQ